MSKYFNNALVGNSKILGCLSDKAEILRLYYPNIDYFQLINFFSLGIYDSNKVYWFKDAEAVNQYYDGNIVYTELKVNDVSVTIRDYILPDKNIFVRALKFMKPSNLLVYSGLNSDVNKKVSSMYADNTLIQYSQDMYMATFSKKDVYKYQINNVKDYIEKPSLFNGEDYIGMSEEAVISYEDVSEISLYITLDSKLADCLKSVKWCKEQDENMLCKSTKTYWEDYMKPFEKLDFLKSISKVNEREIIKRTIYMYKLLSNDETGAVLASPDVDENYTRCGRYGYCWPRDALFINDALYILGMKDQLNKFYNVWAKRAQLSSGLFEQRYYANGELAPSWGLQIDETAAILIGISRHVNYLFLEELILKSTVALMNFIDERGLSKSSYDLWEERKGVHLYSTVSIYAALKASKDMLKVIDDIKYASLLERIDMKINEVRRGINEYFVENGRLKRSLDDYKIDISLLCVCVPFDVFDINDDVVKNTVSEIERTLHMSNGGYMRYQWDNYIGGNTWIVSSLWLAMYYIKLGDLAKARELFDWVTNHADSLYFLPEQIEREGNKTAWVTELSWSHAMYVIVRNMLFK